LLSFRGTRAASCLVIAAMAGLSVVSIDPGNAAWPKEIARAPSKPGIPLKRRTSKPAASKCDPSKFPIILDVGHTAEAPGARSARNVPEFDFNLRLAKRIEERLKSEGFVETSLLVTEGKAKPSLWKRVAAANRLRAKLLLSIHHDSVPDSFLEQWDFEGTKSRFSDRFTGYSLFVSRRNPLFETSLTFGKLLGKQMKAQGLEYARQYTQAFMGRYRRKLLDKDVGIYRFDDLVVLRWARTPAVLFEAGSIINRDEELAMNSQERQDMISAAVAGAVKQFCELR
jgi:N-acetylmuramoyl-L-alanine amidase